MPILLAGNEGEWSLFENVLSDVGKDSKRRGSVDLRSGDQMFRAFPQGSDIWIHARIAQKTTGSTLQTLPFMTVRDSLNQEIFSIRQRLSSSLLTQSSYSFADGGSGVPITDSTDIFPANDLEFITFDLRIQTGATTTYTLYRNEILRFTKVAETALTTPPSQLLFSGISAGVFVQDVIVTNGVPTVGMELATLVPSASATFNDFVNDFENVADKGYSNDTVITASATGQRESWIYSDPEFDFGDKVIYGVISSTVGQTDVANVIADFSPFLRIGATIYDGDPMGASNVAPINAITVWTANPSTNAPWQEDELYGLEAGVLSS